MVLPGAYILLQKELLLLNAKIEPNFKMSEENQIWWKTPLLCACTHMHKHRLEYK